MKWYQIKFRARHKRTGRFIEFVAIAASDVDGAIRPVTLKADLVSIVIRDYDLSGLEGIHAVKVEPLGRTCYIVSMETVIPSTTT